MESAQKLCPECKAPFTHPLRYQSKRAYCSKSCRLKAWRRDRRVKFPEKVRAEEMAAYLRNRDKKMAKMREYHANHRDKQNAKNREWFDEHRGEQNAKRLERHYAHKDEANMKRSENFQKERLVQPWKQLLRSARYRATAKTVPFSLTEEWAAEHWTGRCELTGLEFFLGQRGNGPKAMSPSIDRIQPSIGYVPENCRFIIWAVNAFKGEDTDDEMFRIAESLLSFRNSPL